MKKTITVAFRLLLLLSLLLSTSFSFIASGTSLPVKAGNIRDYVDNEDWLIGWQYRKSHNITSASGAGTDYQIKFTVHYGNGTDSGEDVYLNDKCQPDFDDIRFTDDNKTTLLDYWMENKTDSDNAVFWVEVADDLSSENVTIYLYYGNNGVSTTSCIEDTFPIYASTFEDDATGNLPAGWNNVTGDEQDTFTVETNRPYGGSKSAEHTEYVGSADGEFECNFSTSDNIAVHYHTNFDGASNRSRFYVRDASRNLVTILEIIDDKGKWDYYDGSWHTTPNFGNPSPDTWYEITIYFDSSNHKVKFVEPNLNWDSGWLNDAATLSGNGTLGCGGKNSWATTHWIDNVYIRKYVVSEPSHGSWGDEEERAGENWLIGWQYRKSHNITSASGAGANYQVRIVVHNGSGSDSGKDVYLDSKCKTDFGDIRFTDDDGSTELDYWMMENKTHSDNAVFWVEVADDLSSENVTIYLYYGNNGVSTTSNFDNTFIFGEPFDNATLDTNRWTSVDGNPTYSINTTGNYLEVTDMDAYEWQNGKGFHSKTISLPSSWMIEDAYGNVSGFMLYQSTNATGDLNGGLMCLHNEPWNSSDLGIAGVMLEDAWNASQSWQLLDIVGGNGDYASGLQPGAFAMFRAKMYKVSGNITIDTFGIIVDEANSETPTIFHLGIGRFSTYPFGTVRFGAFIIRKYVDPEPAHSTWGNEEEFSEI